MTRNKFTLFELLLVIMLIALVSGSLTMAFPKMLKNERFESSVKKVEMKILTAYELMLDYDTDVIMTFEAHPKGTVCHIKPIKPLPQKIHKALNKDHLLKEVRQVTFSGKMPLYFNAKGSTPLGTLTIEGQRVVRFHLKGFPGAIVKGDYDNKTVEKATYPQEILSPA